MMTSSSPIVIVGAGPTGLAAALLLTRRGIAVRIVDAATEASPQSKALAVNARTLQLLRGTGVDERIYAEGMAGARAYLHVAGRVPTAVELRQAGLDELLVVLPQARTEALLTEALAAASVQVERGVRLESLQAQAAMVALQLVHRDGSREHVSTPLVFGADGAHSQVRRSLRLGFPGSSLAQPWLLWDLQLDTALDPAAAHVLLLPDGFLFLLRIEAGLWRVISNSATPVQQLPGGTVAGAIRWQSSFQVSHRVASRTAVGRVALGGDAAHIHSPIGARGMNLGIEDAYVFASCAADVLAGRLERMEDYAVLRHAVHRQVVRRIALMTRLAQGRPLPLRWLRDAVMSHAFRFERVRAQLMRTLSGLDHPLRTER